MGDTMLKKIIAGIISFVLFSSMHVNAVHYLAPPVAIEDLEDEFGVVQFTDILGRPHILSDITQEDVGKAIEKISKIKIFVGDTNTSKGNMTFRILAEYFMKLIARYSNRFSDTNERYLGLAAISRNFHWGFSQNFSNDKPVDFKRLNNAIYEMNNWNYNTFEYPQARSNLMDALERNSGTSEFTVVLLKKEDFKNFLYKYNKNDIIKLNTKCKYITFILYDEQKNKLETWDNYANIRVSGISEREKVLSALISETAKGSDDLDQISEKGVLYPKLVDAAFSRDLLRQLDGSS